MESILLYTSTYSNDSYLAALGMMALLPTLFTWVFLSIGVGIAGTNKDCGFLSAVFVSIVFSPLIGALYVITSHESRSSVFKRLSHERRINEILDNKE
ncbi:inorganic phosphate transporter [Flammeovirga yaeyamensis]|uniref:Inorganic phosphate transporter n=1 Tax=Flammeovirga yaeyamensis TaxID=367791 RepID=A0AAX1NDN0_9BACT|nr:hypothetical protein [Flammeovirga yaeyamensis]MBB3700034.1 putative membrane protein [Flammeovirga yaeyamensis]NMF37529.1 hypothetical protein [Flammeovirga yaeyamensis]QWG04586.1 inorganic phosphate transporter [Flammeovirga yaeyamensis]